MSKWPYCVVLLAILVMLAGCGSAAHSTSRANATPTTTPTPTASPCDFKISTTAPTSTGATPQAAHPIGTPFGTSTSSTYGSNYYYGLAMVSDDEGWAVGGREVYQRQSGGTIGTINLLERKALILHYSAGKWASVNMSVSETLLAITMLSRTEGWAVGTQGVILHYHGGSWTVAVAPRTLPYLSATDMNDTSQVKLTSISMVSPTDGWAAGWGRDLDVGVPAPLVPILVHYHGGKWEVVDPYSLTTIDQHSSSVLLLNSVSMTSATDGLAAGIGGLLKYHQGTWTVDPDAPPSLLWESAFARSPIEDWAIGLNSRGSLEVGHYCGGQWHIQAAGITVRLSPSAWAMRMVSPTEGWAGAENMMFHYTNGQWTRVSTSLDVDPVYSLQVIGSISMVSATAGWALVQCSKNGSFGDYTVVLHYQNGSWNAY